MTQLSTKEKSQTAVLPSRLVEKIVRFRKEGNGRRGRQGIGLDYQDVKSFIDRGIRQIEIPGPKGGKEIIELRKCAMDRSELAALRESAGKKFPNPFTRSGAYQAAVQALIDLGVNKWHPLGDIYNRMRTLMSQMPVVGGKTAWGVFSKRGECSDPDSGKKVSDKVAANMAVLQRLTGRFQYGRPLAQVNACIHIKRIGTGGDMKRMYMLDTRFKSEKDVQPKVFVEPFPKKKSAPKKPEVKAPEVKTDPVEASDPVAVGSN